MAMDQYLLIPIIGSMYGIYANIGGIFMVNVTIYSIHGSYGLWHLHIKRSRDRTFFRREDNGRSSDGACRVGKQ